MPSNVVSASAGHADVEGDEESKHAGSLWSDILGGVAQSSHGTSGNNIVIIGSTARWVYLSVCV